MPASLNVPTPDAGPLDLALPGDVRLVLAVGHPRFPDTGTLIVEDEEGTTIARLDDRALAELAVYAAALLYRKAPGNAAQVCAEILAIAARDDGPVPFLVEIDRRWTAILAEQQGTSPEGEPQ